MTWGKMDDKFHRNRKVRALRQLEGGRAALGTWVCWWSWCLDDPELTGVVPADELSAVDEASAQLLVDVGLWDRVEGGYAFHDFHAYNPTRAQIDAKREADRERVASKRKASRSDVARDSVATNTRVAPPGRVPSRPDPDPRSPLPPAGREGASAAPANPEGATSVALVREAVKSCAKARRMLPTPLIPQTDLEAAAERVDEAVREGVAPDAQTAATALVEAAFALGEGPRQRPLRFALSEASIAPNGRSAAQARHVPPEDPWV